ncbi:tRNA lysidine(34) synthetase TilS [Candidatus Viadribacter manganicus]|uniref:tRNA(Ile)-lysidine synthase n=1 Tax=Candidatus Viadribacter manganicus TaxID=1759059 RepID=A0A1B1AK80_9PROT|nr:tRNA lysidine(34) synthetase TilS [Candidatus Viadribacter manganicus]ANP46930.1 hypothetical protein ATE48_13890 [Candidatus Viadribacter manganicus]
MLDRLTIERMMAWTGERPVLIALSGGGDSVALMRLLVAECGAHRLHAAIVDHALRDGSADDAARARSFADALGVAASVLTVSWEEGANRAQQAAREARYRALCEHARSEGLNTIAAAHTSDDQAETLLMRAANGSAWRGLAGIAAFAFAPIWPEGRGIALARPLLGARRDELRSYLREEGAAWIEDPANTNPKFERVRVRARLSQLEANGFEPSRLVHIAKRLRARSDLLDRAALQLIASAASVGLSISIKGVVWSGPRDVRCRALSILIAAAAGASREPSWGEVEQLEQRIFSAGYRGETHTGVAFSPAKHGVTLERERGAVLGRTDGVPAIAPLSLIQNKEAIWDGRLAITASEPGWRVVPARNDALAAFENGSPPAPYAEVEGILSLRPLTAERIAHAVAPDINHAKP